VTTWLTRKLANLCARRGCTVELPEDAEHCLCDEHAEEARERTAVAMLDSRRRTELVTHGPLFAWRVGRRSRYSHS
jgi:hypothetical protein